MQKLENIICGSCAFPAIYAHFTKNVILAYPLTLLVHTFIRYGGYLFQIVR
jgi:hypothetical protein